MLFAHLNIFPPAFIIAILSEYLPAWPTFACLNILCQPRTFSRPPAWISTFLPASLLACLNIYLPASISACLPEYLPACQHLCLPAWISTCYLPAFQHLCLPDGISACQSDLYQACQSNSCNLNIYQTCLLTCTIICTYLYVKWMIQPVKGVYVQYMLVRSSYQL